MSATSSTEEPREVSFTQAFAMLADDEYNDIFLEGTDGVRVPATRLALAVRSEFFHTMFKNNNKGNGGFKEATNQVVPIGFHSQILRAIVEYIHTNESGMLGVEAGSSSETQAREESAEEKFDALLSLTEAAMYVGLPGLCRKAQKCMYGYLAAHPYLAMALLAATKQGGAVLSERLTNHAWGICMSKPGVAFNPTVLGNISVTVLIGILQDSKEKLSNTKRFELIDGWWKSTGSEPSSSTPSSEAKEQRQTVAKTLVKDYVTLEFVDPDYLATCVAPSGLVTTQQMYHAFQQQAKKAKHRHNVCFEESGGVDNPVWKESDSKVLTSTSRWKSDILNVPIFAPGRSYQWTISCAGSDFIWLGVTNSTQQHELDLNQWCGDQSQCWGVYGRDGNEWSNGKLAVKTSSGRDARFGPGSRVVMTLDLSEGDSGNGTLYISVNGQRAIAVVSNLLDSKGSGSGFSPAASCYAGASATIVDGQVPF